MSARSEPARSADQTRAEGAVGSARRCFLGWERPLLDAAADWIHAELGGDLSELFVALPGARAARALRAALARRAGPSAFPPRILTIGALTDELVLLDAPRASRMARTLAWARALRELEPEELARVVPHPPEPADLAGWTRLAEEVRRLFAELVADGLDFRAVAQDPRGPAEPAERARFRTLAQAQESYLALLAQGDVLDPHAARRQAIEARRIDPSRAVVLVGVADANALQRRLLAELGARVTALVFAPEELAAAFDPLGCLIVEAWRERSLDLPLERWRVVEGPDEQACAALELLAEWGPRFAADEMAIGVADPEVAPYLRRRLAAAGVSARDAAGTPMERSAPARLLRALARTLRTRGAGAHAELLRHPDLEEALRARPDLAAAEPAARLDDYRIEHLAPRIDGDWLGRADELAAIHRALLSLLGELAAEGARPLSHWAEPVRAFLTAVYGTRSLGNDEGERALAESLAVLGTALAELGELAEELAPHASAADALEFLARAVRGASLPPPEPRPGEASIELLGWLELALDPTPALVVTGFQDGRIPAAVHGDAFLPNGLRRALGLVDDERRLARDVYALELLLRAPRETAFVTGRRSARNDPLLPSRLAFHCDEGEMVRRVRHFLPGRDVGFPAAASVLTKPPRRVLARRADFVAPEIYTVTSFRRFLESPYLFYLEHVLRLETIDDRLREMDGRAFGILAHDVLAAFGRSALRDAPDEAQIAGFFASELARRARARYGSAPLPAVALQIEQLGFRLALFAGEQAARARAGWRIAHIEWAPAAGWKELEVDDAPVRVKGRIDRIDVHADGRFALFDYKAGDASRKPSPAKAHRARDGSWRDLQLPLYCWLTAELEMEAPPLLGYAALGKSAGQVGFFEIEGWDEEVVESALEAAREIVRKVRRGELFEVGSAEPAEPVLRALCGQGLFGGTSEEGAEDEEAEPEP